MLWEVKRARGGWKRLPVELEEQLRCPQVVCVRLELVESKHVPFSDQEQKLQELAAALVVRSVLFLSCLWSFDSVVRTESVLC